MPYNNPIKKNGSSCTRMYNSKGKPAGLMVEGSAMHMSMLQQEKTKKVEEAKAKKLDKEQEIKEKKDLLTEMPIDNRGVGQMSPYKLTEKDKPEPKAFVDPGAPEGFVADAPDVGEAASKKFFASQDIVNKAVQTLEDIEGGKTPYTGYAGATSTVTDALLGGKGRKGRLTTGQLKSLAKSDPVKGMEYLSRNIRNAPLGDARRMFDKSYNPFKQS